MINVFKSVTRREHTDETDRPPQADERAAEVSQDAADVVDEIDDVLDDVLADVDQAESEQDKARRELHTTRLAREAGEISLDEVFRRYCVWQAAYAHLDLGCVC